MPDDWRKDLERARLAATKHWPEYAEACGGGSLQPVEGEHGEISPLLDQIAGIDYLVRLPGGGVRSLSMRVQFEPLLYASFTIRESRRTGRLTELPKKLAAVDQKTMISDLTVQLYVSKDSTRLIGWGVISTAMLLRFIKLNTMQDDVFFNKRKAPDGNWFLVVWWEWLRDAAISVESGGDIILQPPWTPSYSHMANCKQGGRCNVCDAVMYRYLRRELANPAARET